MENYICLNGKKINISEETANSLGAELISKFIKFDEAKSITSNGRGVANIGVGITRLKSGKQLKRGEYIYLDPCFEWEILDGKITPNTILVAKEK